MRVNNDPSAKRHLNGVLLAGRWWSEIVCRLSVCPFVSDAAKFKNKEILYKIHNSLFIEEKLLSSYYGILYFNVSVIIMNNNILI